MYKDRLKSIREENKITQEEIAKYIGIHRGRYSQYETEIDIFPINHLISACDFYNVSLDYIFDFTNEKQYTDTNNTVDNKQIGLRLKEFRKDNNLTQNKLASILNTNQSVIANYERGRNIIATPFLYEICNKYRVSADYLLGKINEPKNF